MCPIVLSAHFLLLEESPFFFIMFDQFINDFPYNRSARCAQRTLRWGLAAALNNLPRSSWFSIEQSLVSFQSGVLTTFQKNKTLPPTKEPHTAPPPKKQTLPLPSFGLNVSQVFFTGGGEC